MCLCQRAERALLLRLLSSDPKELSRGWGDCYFPKAGSSFKQMGRARCLYLTVLGRADRACLGETLRIHKHSELMCDAAAPLYLWKRLEESWGPLQQLAAWLCQHCIAGAGGRWVQNRPVVEKKFLSPFFINLPLSALFLMLASSK